MLVLTLIVSLSRPVCEEVEENIDDEGMLATVTPSRSRTSLISIIMSGSIQNSDALPVQYSV